MIPDPGILGLVATNAKLGYCHLFRLSCNIFSTSVGGKWIKPKSLEKLQLKPQIQHSDMVFP